MGCAPGVTGEVRAHSNLTSPEQWSRRWDRAGGRCGRGSPHRGRVGTTTIKGEPTRIVALDSSLADATLLLEKNLVGIATYRGYTTELPEYLGDVRES